MTSRERTVLQQLSTPRALHTPCTPRTPRPLHSTHSTPLALHAPCTPHISRCHTLLTATHSLRHSTDSPCVTLLTLLTPSLYSDGLTHRLESLAHLRRHQAGQRLNTPPLASIAAPDWHCSSALASTPPTHSTPPTQSLVDCFPTRGASRGADALHEAVVSLSRTPSALAEQTAAAALAEQTAVRLHSPRHEVGFALLQLSLS